MKCLSCLSISGQQRISPADIIYTGQYWVVDHAYPTSLAGWVVIVLKRHVEALHDLSPEEFQELSYIQQRLITIFKKRLKTEKEYLACFSEAAQFKHIHFHVIPKTAEYPADAAGVKAFSLLKAPVSEVLTKNEVTKISDILRGEFQNFTTNAQP